MRTALHVAANALVLMGVLWACRFVYRRSRLAGLLFAAGVLIRAGGAAFFVSVSYFNLPFMTASQMGDGFWTLAPDAEEYYRLTLLVVDHWQYTITAGYTVPLAVFMRAVGVSPAGPALFALVSHVVAVVTIVAAFGRIRSSGATHALDLVVAAFSFSPILIYANVFGLKDVFTTTLIVIVGVAYWALAGTEWTRRRIPANLLALAAAAVALWYISGTRTYFALLMWGAIAVASAGCVIGARPSRRRAAVQAIVVVPFLALVLAHGAETLYPWFVMRIMASLPGAVAGHQSPMARGGLDELDRRRRAIDGDGGDSVFNRYTGTSARDRLKGLTIGLSAIFVPITVLDKLSIVDIKIRTTARLIADADTLVIDATAILALWLLVVHRGRLNPDPVIFSAALVVLVALPLAYVMTNYGTLIRLRLMVAAPIWLLTLALAPTARQADPALTSV